MFNIVLYEPEIPPNTGNIIRLCANSGAALHLIKPLGFELDNKKLKRAGLDYKEWMNLELYDNYSIFLKKTNPRKLYAFTTKATSFYTSGAYQPGDYLVFGPETRGLPDFILDDFEPDHKLRIPMQAHSRSLNLSNSVAIVIFEAWRQNSFLNGL